MTEDSPFNVHPTDRPKLYAVGDIHGRSDLLEPLLARIEEHISLSPSARSIIVFLGDYVDRGSSSRQVIDQLLRLKDSHETVFLRGNHEEYLLNFLGNPSFLPNWLRLGGLDTLRSYGLAPTDHRNTSKQELLAKSLTEILSESRHLDFLENLMPSFACGDYFFAHAGVRPGVPLDQQEEKDLLEIRGEFLRYRSDFGKIVVHGHTPVLKPEVHSNRINIDTGAYATGKLTCLVIENDRLEFV